MTVPGEKEVGASSRYFSPANLKACLPGSAPITDPFPRQRGSGERTVTWPQSCSEVTCQRRVGWQSLANAGVRSMIKTSVSEAGSRPSSMQLTPTRG